MTHGWRENLSFFQLIQQESKGRVYKLINVIHDREKNISFYSNLKN